MSECPAVRRAVIGAVTLCLVGSALFVADQALRTLRTLDAVERERDSWQRPGEVLRHLDLHPGDTILDLGSGAGYFALKMAPRVAPGRVLAVDLRRLSLAFLWLRARLDGLTNIRVVHATLDDPSVPPGPIDAVLVANTYHELSAPRPILEALFTSMRAGARLVVVDRGPREPGGHRTEGGHHDVSPGVAEREIGRLGFSTIVRVDRFIDRPAEPDVWWLIAFRKP